MLYRKNIKFIPSKELIDSGQNIISPVPAKDVIPEWYKQSELKFKSEDGRDFNGLKTCIPFIDSLISGYIVRLQNDLYVENVDEKIGISWEGNIKLISERSEKLGSKIPVSHENLKNHLVWRGLWGIKVPRKHSVLITHPLNREDLPFRSVSAIMDSDKMYAWGNIPFYIKNNFSGVIKAGTPIYQVFPIKREEWIMSVDQSWTETAVEQSDLCRSVDRGYYRDNFWSKKRFV